MKGASLKKEKLTGFRLFNLNMLKKFGKTGVVDTSVGRCSNFLGGTVI
jgi:hypothetical protein